MTSSVDLNTEVTVRWKQGTPELDDVTLAVTRPDGALAGPAPVVSEDPAGVYTAKVATPLPGRYVLAWTSSTADATYTDVLNVFPEDPRFMISLTEAKTMLSMRGSGDEDALRIVLAAVTVVLEDIVGPILLTQKTQDAHGDRPAINLWHRAAEIVSVHESGQLLTEEADYHVWEAAGILYAGARTAPRSFAPGSLNIRIVYSAGSTELRPNLRLAVSTLLRHLWEIHQAGHNAAHNIGADDDDLVPTQSGYLVPHVVMSLCQPEDPFPGIG